MTLELRDVSFTYRSEPVLKSVSFAFSAGDFILLLGANGSGKSTMLKIAAGFLSPQRGAVWLAQRKIADYVPRIRAQKIAIVLSSPPPALDFTVKEIVALGRNPYRSPFSDLSGDDEIAIDNAMRLTETTKFSDRAVNRLSDGERARVMLANAIAQTPQFLLLDEPTAALDPEQTPRMLAMLRDLAKSGIGIVAAIHDLSAVAFATEIAMLKSGEILVRGTADAIFTEDNLAAVYGPEAKIWADFFRKNSRR